MSFGLMAVVYDVMDKIEAGGNKDHIYRVLKAMKLSENGDSLFASRNGMGAIEKHEAALKELEGIPQAASIQGAIMGALVSDYGIAGQPGRALAIGHQALKELGKDPRLAVALGNCLHDMGVAMVSSSKPAEAISYLERALRAYETTPDGAGPAANCLRDINRIKTELHGKVPTRDKPKSWISRLLGK